jgi:hypothetical protein
MSRNRIVFWLQVLALVAALACVISAWIHDDLAGYKTRATVDAMVSVTFALIAIGLGHLRR